MGGGGGGAGPLIILEGANIPFAPPSPNNQTRPDKCTHLIYTCNSFIILDGISKSILSIIFLTLLHYPFSM